MKKYTDIFPMRLKALRNAYGISLSETAYLLRVNAKSTVFEWENQKKVPSVENLHMISTVFGTPTDWLLGHSEILYSEESIKWTENFISWIENSMQNRFDELTGTEPGGGVSFWLDYLQRYYPEYVSEEQRVQYYSLPVRANIAVLMRQVRLPSLYWRMYYAQNGFKKRGVIAKVKEFFHMSAEEELKAPNRKELERGDNLVDLLTLNTINGKSVANKMPIYDVEDAYRQLQQEIPGTDE